jgi:DnaJ-class molecular chaperone
VNITLKEALLGFIKEIKHLDGHEVELDRFGKVTKPGFIHKIPGEGMPYSDYSGNIGDLIVTYKVTFPTTLTDEQKTLFKGFFAS